MSKHPVVPIATILVLLAGAGSAGAQQSDGCPAVEDGVGTPIELRIGDFVLRAQVTGDAGESGEGTRVEGRLVGCERDRRIQASPDDTDATAPPSAGTGILFHLLHDLRIGLELGPARDGECVRARLEIMEAVTGVAGTAGEQPLAVELCGLPFTRRPAPPTNP